MHTRSTTKSLRALIRMLLCVVLSTVAAPALLADDDIVEGEAILELNPSATIEEILTDYGLVLLDGIPQWKIYLVELPAAADPVAVLAALEDDPRLDEAEPHRRFETPEGVQISIPDLDFTYTPDSYVQQPAVPQIHAAEATARYTGAGVIVAVLDSGVDFQHPALRPNLVLPGRDFAGGDGTGREQDNGLDDDLDGLIDESSGHGTFVAGLIRLVAPDARILSVRVLDSDGKGTGFTVARGILFALESQADVINLSLGMEVESAVLEEALKAAKQQGAVVVAAAGNRGVQSVDFPASSARTVAVAAVDGNGVRAPFSSYGSEVDVSTPGVDLLSTFSGSIYVDWSGTSFATPLISAAAALMRERYPSLGVDQLVPLLAQSAQPDGNGPALDGLMGAGVADLDALTQTTADDRSSLRVTEMPAGATLSWSPVLGATSYDVIRGDLSVPVHAPWPQGQGYNDLGDVTCLAAQHTGTDGVGFPDPTLPAPGEGFFYLFRVHGDDVGYDPVAEDEPRIVSTGDCQP